MGRPRSGLTKCADLQLPAAGEGWGREAGPDATACAPEVDKGLARGQSCVVGRDSGFPPSHLSLVQEGFYGVLLRRAVKSQVQNHESV